MVEQSYKPLCNKENCGAWHVYLNKIVNGATVVDRTVKKAPSYSIQDE
jgi:hypothetical protein